MNPEYQQKLDEIRKWEKERHERQQRDKPYNARNMNIGRMPLGCSLWLILGAVLAFWVIKKYILGL